MAPALLYQALGSYVGALPLETLKGHDDRVWSVTFSPGVQRLASGSDDKTIEIREALFLPHIDDRGLRGSGVQGFKG